MAQGPSFDCGQVEAGSIEAMICKDEGLAARDRTLAEVYAAASHKAVNERPPVLSALKRPGHRGGRQATGQHADRLPRVLRPSDDPWHVSYDGMGHGLLSARTPRHQRPSWGDWHKTCQ